MSIVINKDGGIPVTYISQNITVIGWTHDQAVESAPFLHVILNDLIKNEKVDIVFEKPEFGLFIYKVKGVDLEAVFTFTFLIHSNLNVDVLNISG